MRISNTNRLDKTGAKTGAKRSGSTGSAFSLDSAGETQHSASVRSPQGIAGVDALIAIQGIGDPLTGKARAVRRGHAMLDVLEDLKLDLLAGAISPLKLKRLAKVVGEAAGDSGDPKINSVLEEIELRARVELAKHEAS